MTTREWIEEMAARIAREFAPLRIILSGSHARGDATRYSDVDLLVVLGNVESKHDAAAAMHDLLSDCPVAKDIIVATQDEVQTRGHLPGTVLRPALREGRLLYERD